jgi:hypothetical protein
MNLSFVHHVVIQLQWKWCLQGRADNSAPSSYDERETQHSWRNKESVTKKHIVETKTLILAQKHSWSKSSPCSTKKKHETIYNIIKQSHPLYNSSMFRWQYNEILDEMYGQHDSWASLKEVKHELLSRHLSSKFHKWTEAIILNEITNSRNSGY